MPQKTGVQNSAPLGINQLRVSQEAIYQIHCHPRLTAPSRMQDYTHGLGGTKGWCNF